MFTARFPRMNTGATRTPSAGHYRGSWATSPRRLVPQNPWTEMLRISYSAASGADVEGTSQELHAIHHALLELVLRASGAWSQPADNTGDPHPFDRLLTGLAVSISPGPTRAHVDEDYWLNIRGNPDCLKAFASFFDVPTNARQGWHVHHEYYDGNRWVAPDSEPLTISVRRPTGP